VTQGFGFCSCCSSSIGALFFFLLLADGKKKVPFPFSGGRGDYTGPLRCCSAPHRIIALPTVCCRPGLADLTHGMAGQAEQWGLYGLWTT
jgi:hypothetical protein